MDRSERERIRLGVIRTVHPGCELAFLTPADPLPGEAAYRWLDVALHFADFESSDLPAVGDRVFFRLSRVGEKPAASAGWLVAPAVALDDDDDEQDEKQANPEATGSGDGGTADRGPRDCGGGHGGG